MMLPRGADEVRVDIQAPFYDNQFHIIVRYFKAGKEIGGEGRGIPAKWFITNNVTPNQVYEYFQGVLSKGVLSRGVDFEHAYNALILASDQAKKQLEEDRKIATQTRREFDKLKAEVKKDLYGRV